MEQNISALLEKALYRAAFRKAVFSRPNEKTEVKTVATLFLHKGETLLRCERFLTDGKAIQKNYPLTDAVDILSAEAEKHRQINLYTQSGEAEIRISEKGKVWCKDRIAISEATPNVSSHNREKEYIIDKDEAFDFLFALDIVDKNHRILDKKQAKFRQINHFLEFVQDALPQLPQGDEPITVWDLCCGKSYLTFAVYYYLAIQQNRSVTVYAVDRKQDMMEKCQKIAQNLQYHGMHFMCMDIHDFQTEREPDLVLSLHACDIATDIVLAHAVRHHARVILSAPCCHHEMSRQIHCDPLRFIQRHSILKQKLCDAATDALRALRLEAEGYQVNALEFIDPDETPKNTLIRAYRMPGYRVPIQKAALQEYEAACAYLGVTPYLHKLLSENNEKTSSH